MSWWCFFLCARLRVTSQKAQNTEWEEQNKESSEEKQPRENGLIPAWRSSKTDILLQSNCYANINKRWDFFIDTLSIPINSLQFGDSSARAEKKWLGSGFWQLLKTFTLSSLNSILLQTHKNYFTPRRWTENNLEFSLKILQLCNKAEGEKTNSWSRCDVCKNETCLQ